MSHVSFMPRRDFALWEKLANGRKLYSFDFELTARCNLNCRHCYINLPVSDKDARAAELSVAEISDIADQAIELGALWCLITGGEPLLRPEFSDIYLMLRRKGLLLSVFTNATLIQPDHVSLFKKHPPQAIEITVYGATSETYERITRRVGSYTKFLHGVESLLEAGVPVSLKAMALRSNLHEMKAIAAFAKSQSREIYRFDPHLILRYDRNAERNREIRSERLTPAEIVALERADSERFGSLLRNCEHYIDKAHEQTTSDHLFFCGAGRNTFSLGYDGTFRLCSALFAPGTTVNLRECSLRRAWEELVPRVRNLRSADPDYLKTCRRCALVNLCEYCPAHADLETGRLDGATPYFCELAHARAAAIEQSSVQRAEKDEMVG
ncbi:MAG TPA: radical SAM protein [bacterium]|nr:radical SAM protein [bacterium]HNT67424.1 radical SAM protein [bacterium]